MRAVLDNGMLYGPCNLCHACTAGQWNGYVPCRALCVMSYAKYSTLAVWLGGNWFGEDGIERGGMEGAWLQRGVTVDAGNGEHECDIHSFATFQFK